MRTTPDRTLTSLVALAGFIGLLLLAMWPDAALAQTGETCTTEATYQVSTTPMISRIAETIQNALVGASQAMFDNIRQTQGMTGIVFSILTLYFAIFGVLFMTGMVELNAGDVIIRVIKATVILILFTPQGWTLVDNILGGFFRDGTNQLIDNISQVMLQPFQTVTVIGVDNCGWTPPPTAPAGANPPPLFILDCAAQQIFSLKFATTVLASLGTGPYGIIFTILLVVGMIMFIGAVGQAVWIFFMFWVVNTLLLGLAPIFITFMLFSKTRFLFDGWMQQLVNYSLQPIFMFSFLGLFVSLIFTSLSNILIVEKCWTTFLNIIGTNVEVHFWRFMRRTNPTQYTSSQVPDSRSMDFDGPAMRQPNEPVFPIDIMDVLIFVLLCSIAWRFSTFVVYIAKEISGGFMMLTQLPGSLSHWFEATRSRAAASGRAMLGGHSTSGGGRGVGGISGAKHEWRHHMK